MERPEPDGTQPQTVAFYSFKGGHGRTTSLVNVANLCARMGHAVLCIDLDLEAPGLSSLYGLPLETPGFVEYAADVLAKADPPFDPIAVDVDPIGDASGSLHVMPAGRFAGVPREQSAHYWSFMGRGAQEVFSTTPVAEEFWSHVRNSVFEHSVGFDYVFVDLRSGFSPLSLVGLKQWPGSLAIFLSRRVEASEGTRLLLETLPESFFNQPNYDRVCVLTRRPRFLTETEYAREHFEVGTQGRRGQTVMYDDDWLQSIVRERASRVIMQADPEVEAFGYQLIRPTGEILNRPLLDNYLELASRLAPRVFPPAEGRKNTGRDLISTVLQQPADLKVFRRSEEGDFVNFGDMEPNIAFKVETLQNLLDHLCSSINGDLELRLRFRPQTDRGEPAPRPSAEVLEAAGQSSGEAFGRALRDDIFGDNPHVVTPSEEELITRWCEFDSSTGWARLSLEKRRESRDLFLNWCTIRAEYNAFGRRDLRDEPIPGVPPQDLCYFLKGYISGVLTGLIRATTQVVHKKADCMFHRGDVNPCRFLVVVTRNPDARHPEFDGPPMRPQPVGRTDSDPGSATRAREVKSRD